MLPSISDPQHEGGGTDKIAKDQALGVLRSAIGGKPYRVTDKMRLRYVLYRAEPDSDLLKLVLRLIPHHPEHADAFFTYLGRFGYRKPIERLCLDLVWGLGEIQSLRRELSEAEARTKRAEIEAVGLAARLEMTEMDRAALAERCDALQDQVDKLQDKRAALVVRVENQRRELHRLVNRQADSST